MKNIINDDIKYIAQKFKNNHYQIYLVGGCVRDALLNITPHDYDLTTDATPEIICQLFSDNKIKKEGIKEGSVTVIINNSEYEITTFRLEDNYSDHRHPDNITFTDKLEDDLKRRDFTINAIAYSFDNKLIDIYNGINDLKNGLIKTVGNSDLRFNEDALRILRALRFSSQLGFSIENNTKKSIFKYKNLLLVLSKERIYEEFSKIIISPYCTKVLIDYRNIFEIIYPQISNISYSHYNQICQSIANCNKDINLSLALYFHSVTDIKEVDNLILTKKNISEINFLISNQFLIIPLSKNELKNLLRDNSFYLIKKLIKYQFLLKYIDSLNYCRYIELLNKIEKDNECYKINMLKINGNDLLKLDIEPKKINSILNNILELVIDNKLENDKNEIICYIKNVKDKLSH